MNDLVAQTRAVSLRIVAGLCALLGTLAGPLATIFILSALATLIALIWPSDTVFSVRANTDIVVIEPICTSRPINWRLRPGVLYSNGVNGPHSAVATREVSVEVRPGGQLEITQNALCLLQVRFGKTRSRPACANSEEEPVLAKIDGKLVDYKDANFQYVEQQKEEEETEEKKKKVNHCATVGENLRAGTMALPFEGRAVIGASLAQVGSTTVTSQLLRSADIAARTKIYETGQSQTVLNEHLDAGGIIDTHPQLEGDPAVACKAWRESSSALGLVTFHKEGGLDVQVHIESRKIGVTTLGAAARELMVPFWSKFVVSPVVQVFAAAVLLFAAMIQVVPAFHDIARRSTPRLPSKDEHVIAVATHPLEQSTPPPATDLTSEPVALLSEQPSSKQQKSDDAT